MSTTTPSTTSPTTASTSAQRTQACQIIWGPGDYDIDLETDDWESFWGVIRREYENELDPYPLILTKICDSKEAAMEELDRLLHAWARQTESGKKQTTRETLEMLGVDDTPAIMQFAAMLKESMLEESMLEESA
ncbi:hypothetical protein BJX99DRAFT_259946 [Aspergillus californicus]